MTFDITRAWKDEDYRNSLSDEQLAQLPENPAGQVELSDEELGKVAAGLMRATRSSECCDNSSVLAYCS